jgi:hypothetical protein
MSDKPLVQEELAENIASIIGRRKPLDILQSAVSVT